MFKNCILVQLCGIDIFMVFNMNDSRMMVKSCVIGQLFCGRNDCGDQIFLVVFYRCLVDYIYLENECLQ